MDEIKHCPLCGAHLTEIGLGFLECCVCHAQFLPTNNGKEYSLSWVDKV
jgi:hypothetical protein